MGPTQLSIARLSGALPPGVKLPASEADHSFILSVKFEWNYASSPSLCLNGIYGDAFTFCRENFPSVRNVYYVHMVCWPILFLPHVAGSVGRLVFLLFLLLVVVVVGEVTTVLLRSGAGGFVTLVLLWVVVFMTVVIIVVVVLVKATFCVAWNTVKIWAFHTFEEDC